MRSREDVYVSKNRSGSGQVVHGRVGVSGPGRRGNGESPDDDVSVRSGQSGAAVRHVLRSGQGEQPSVVRLRGEGRRRGDGAERALVQSATDLSVPGQGLSFVLTRTYINQLKQNPTVCENCLGDLGWNWTSGNAMRLVEGDTSTPPGSLIVCYDINFERTLTQVSSSPLQYSGGTSDQDMTDDIFQETVSGTTYWVLKKCGGMKYYFYPLDATSPGGRSGGRLYRVKSPSGDTLTYSYGSNGRASSVVDSVGNTVSFTYYTTSGHTKMLQTAAGNGVTVYYAYDDKRNLARVTQVTAGTQRTTLYVYRKHAGDVVLAHNLLYVVGPDQYAQMVASGSTVKDVNGNLLSGENLTNGSVVYDPDPTQSGSTWTWSDYACATLHLRRVGGRQGPGDGDHHCHGRDDHDRLRGESDQRGAQRPERHGGHGHHRHPGGRLDGPQMVDELGRLLYEERSDGTVTRARADGRGLPGAGDGGDLSGRPETAVHLPYRLRPGQRTAESGASTAFPSYEVIEYDDSGTQRFVLASYTYGVPGFGALPKTKTTYLVGDDADLAGDGRGR